ncbi:MAG: lamin tail domain-containing protein [Flavobacteriales bacterium]|nr:lamin tail domain-containing protein [Flavobacteriales bacterium]
MIRATFRALSGSFAALATLVASAQFTDDFDDNDYTNGPVWNGDAALFVCVGGQLRSNSPGAANYHLSTPSTQAAGAQWEFFINLKFATSGANYADVYLMSSAADLASGVDGYYVRIGGTQDRVELFRSDAGAGTALIASADGIVNSSSDNPFRIRVKRDAGDLWTLETDDGATGTYTLAGSATDATHGSCTHFGIRIEQSTAASPVNNHFFDDIGVGPIPVDVTPPAVVSVTATSATNVDVVFSEPLNGAALGSFDILPFIGVSAAVLDGLDPALVHITPGIALTSGSTYTLVASGAEDLAGNAAASSNTDFSWFVPDEALPGEVGINEILADPTPVLGLPEAEYVEVLNTSSTKTFDLGGWTFSDGGTPAALPSVLLPPGTFAILTDDANAALFAGFGTVVSIGSFPALNNDGDPLALRDDNGQLIDTVTYALAWYNDAVKDDGGWSLERRDPTTPCSSTANWTASTDPQGGTPGAQNSVFAIVPDTQAPALVAAQVLTPDQLRLLFNEPMDLASLAAGTYTLDPPVAVNTVVVENPLAVRLDLAAALVVGQLYTVTAADVQDCPGNAIGTANTAQLALPEAPTAGDVVINELLYDPRTGGSDFVELYNRSNKTLSLADLVLANETDGQIGSPLPVSTLPVLLLPGQYVVLTEDLPYLVNTYPQTVAERALQTDLPSYNNGEGVVVLLAAGGDTLERFAYDDDLHFELLNSIEGVSLERVDPARPAEDRTNWHSAAELAGWATPGFLNSQFSEAPRPTAELTIEPAIFSPDNDGFQDLLTVSYRFEQPGFTGTLTVFDLAGRPVRELLNNALLGVEGAVSWDGIRDDGSKARIGPYVLVLEAYDLQGEVERIRRTVTLAHRLN